MRLLRSPIAVLACAVAACASIGPGTVPHDRIDYGSSIGNSWKEQTLLNIIKLRYADMPIFLEVQLQSALSGTLEGWITTLGGERYWCCDHQRVAIVTRA